MASVLASAEEEAKTRPVTIVRLVAEGAWSRPGRMYWEEGAVGGWRCPKPRQLAGLEESICVW